MYRRSLQIALLIAMLFFAGTQCLSACTAAPPVADHLPPCHKQTHSVPSHSCANAQLVVDYGRGADLVTIAALVPIALPAPMLIATQLPYNAREASPPASPPLNRSTVLRI